MEISEIAPVLAWHFLPETGKLAHGGGRTVRAGDTFRVTPPLKLCANGLHGAVRPIDALRYAPSPIIERVEHSGEIVRGDDKLCSSVRRTLWVADATRTLHEFAVWCARHALENERTHGREPDARSWAGLEAKLAWVDGRITDDQLAAAQAAAWIAAGAAAGDAAQAVAWNAAWSAAGAVAGAVARDEQNSELERRLLALTPAAAV